MDLLLRFYVRYHWRWIENMADDVRYFVMRTHSHTDKQQLWKVMSRGFKDRRDAVSWMEYQKDICTIKKHDFFIITKTTEP